jgi:peptidoglycan hydrolase-like protein with peptidoglycan-binding domain
MKKLFSFIFFLFFGLFPIITYASGTNGTIDSTHKYAWSENAGWINFGCENCNTHVTYSEITGYAWSQNYGWINLNPSLAGIKNDGSGNLSGKAWGENFGWIDFNGVNIDSNGNFKGQTQSNDTIGKINFECVNCSVKTDWRPIGISPNNFILISPLNNYSSTQKKPTFSWNAPASNGSSIAKYQLYIDNGLTIDNISPSKTSVTLTSDLSCATHSWKVKTINELGNGTFSDTRNYTVSCTGSAGQYVGSLGGIANLQRLRELKDKLASTTTTTTTEPLITTLQNIKSGSSRPATPTTLSSNLSAGSSGTEVKLLQQFLNNNGFTIAESGPGSKGNETTYFGAATQNALLQFQKANGIDPLGIVGPATRAKINEILNKTNKATVSSATSIQSNLSTGSRGPEVKFLQQYLNTHGFTISTTGPGSPGNETDFFGSATREALRKFQQSHGLDPVGTVGPATRGVVNGE